VINDRETGRSRGFGFVEIETDNITEVIRATDGKEIDGRNLRVNEAENKPGGDRNDRGGFSGGRRNRY
jgi:RNA recognition motif-containing protein